MRFNICLLLFLTLPFAAIAQRVVTFDPEKDPVARRFSNGAIQLVVPARVLTQSIQEAMAPITDIHTIGIQQVGKSNYLVASGKERAQPLINYAVAILLVETTPGEFQADNLVIACTSAGECRECSLPPLCNCDKGEGGCSQSSTLMPALKKVTVTLFE